MVSNYSRFIFQLFKLVNVISLQGPVTGPLYVLAGTLGGTQMVKMLLRMMMLLKMSVGLIGKKKK